MTTPEEVLSFWIDEVGPGRWYRADPALDARVRERFGALWETAASGGIGHWLCNPQSALALVIVLDQFPRNIFRGEARAFATDSAARAAAKRAVVLGWDMRVAEPERQFFYLPLMHSECLCDQDRGVRLFLTRMPLSGEDNLAHARAHRAEIRRFGRFPHRNLALGRTETDAERAYLATGGYGRTLREMEAARLSA
ncbi:MAG: DUF924 domain-containing protein [Alphaproteobacteria bacterium HGW-Alphaproteobacteria-2]|nr:MAG: DUF924 domain-containing protein [Alphaproteobacteria bacterium HGW-Alphaproteobacteria-2]